MARLACVWGRNALFSKYGMQLLKPLCETQYNIIIRPHPQTFISEKELLNQLQEQTKIYSNIMWDNSVDNIYAMEESDIIIGDYSGVLFDYLALFNKPIMTTEFKFNVVGYDLEDTSRKKPWVGSAIQQMSYIIQPQDFNQIKTIIHQVLTDQEKEKQRTELKNTLWQYQNQSGKRSTQILLDIQKNVLENKLGDLLSIHHQLQNIYHLKGQLQ